VDVLSMERPLRRRGALGSTVVVTALLGAVAAVAFAAGSVPAARTFAALAGPTQSLMSVTVPFLGVLLVGEQLRPVRSGRTLAAAARALGLALLVAGFGVLVCAVVTAAFPSEAVGGRWHSAGMVALGSLLVQGVAQLVGTGLGLLIRRPILACLATIVIPLGLWWLLGAVAMLRPTQAWLTPYPSVQHLLSGDMTPTSWTQWLSVLAIWGVGLNACGILRSRRRGADRQDEAGPPR
jgi:hypothetical protein